MKLQFRSNSKLQLVIIISLFAIVNIISYYSQNRINVNDGKDWDGTVYYDMAENFSQGKPLIGAAPYIYRIGTPFLASLISGNDLLTGFYIVNVAANFFSCILLFYFLRLFIKSFPVILILMLFYLSHWLCNVRLVYFFPTFSDYWGVVFLMAGLLIVEEYKIRESVSMLIMLIVVSFIGVFFREYIIIVPVSFLFIYNPISTRNAYYINPSKILQKKLFLPLIGALAGIIITHLIVTNNDTEYTFFGIATYLLFGKSFFQFIYAAFLAIGPLIVLLLIFHKQIIEFLKGRQNFSVLVLSALIICYVGGIHTERFILWFTPLILVFLGIIIEKNEVVLKRFSVISVLLVTQLLANRVFFTTLNPYEKGGFRYPVLTVIGNGSYHNLTSNLADRKFELILFGEYCILLFFLYLLLVYFSSRRRKVSMTSNKLINQ